jgi:hypothetical protein
MHSIPSHHRDHGECFLYDEAESFRFQIEGSFSDAQAKDLEHSRRTASSVIGGRSWILTLGDVTRIEPLGRALLRQWSREGVRIVAASPLLRSIVRSIAGEPVRSRIGPEPSPAEAWEEYVDSVVSGIENDQAPRRVPHALIRHYAEAVFVPGSTLAEALRLAPDFGQSDGEWCLVRVDDRHAYSVASVKRVQSIREFVSAIRRLIAITRFREQDDGVSIEMEAIGLSCDVPDGLRWLVEGLVRLVSRASLSKSLRRLAFASGVPRPIEISLPRLARGEDRA